MSNIFNKKVTYKYNDEVGEGILIAFGITYIVDCKHETSGIIIRDNGRIVNIPIRYVTVVDTSCIQLQQFRNQEIPTPPAPPQPQSRTW